MKTRTPYDSALEQALLDAASEHGDERLMQKFVTKLMGSHSQNSQGWEKYSQVLFDNFPKGNRDKYRDVVERFNESWLKSHGEFNLQGYVNYLDSETHSRIQFLAAGMDQRVVRGVLRRKKEDERRKSFWERLGVRGEIK